MAQLVSLFAQQTRFGARLRKLISQPFDLGCEIANTRIGPPTGAANVLELETKAL
jgi:hypothetical protein